MQFFLFVFFFFTVCSLCEKEKLFFLQVFLPLPIENILDLLSGNRTTVFCSATLELNISLQVTSIIHCVLFLPLLAHVHIHITGKRGPLCHRLQIFLDHNITVPFSGKYCLYTPACNVDSSYYSLNTEAFYKAHFPLCS